MIQRKTTNKFTDSLVNTASSEHLHIAEGIRTDVPVTNLRSVPKSINFLTEPDGSCTLRMPLILKNFINKNTWYLYDKQHMLQLNDLMENDVRVGYIPNIINPDDSTETNNITLKYYDATFGLNELKFSSNADYNWHFLEVISVTSLQDYTLISAKIKWQSFANDIKIYNENHITNYSTDLVYENANYDTLDNGLLYRFIKIYQDTESTSLSWIFEIVHPELNSITSATSTEAMLDVNLLADNPYAIRDLYGYGYISTTKILPYIVFNYKVAQINTHDMVKLTESVPHVTDNTIEGYKLLVSGSPNSLGNNAMLLKAFLTTAKTDAVYYGVWEESTNGGVDWKVCQEFINKYESNTEHPLVTKFVSDLTSEEFEKMAYQESLEQAATYLVEKQLVRLNYKFKGLNPIDLSETDTIAERPDVLYISSPNLSKKYRFQVYIDTLKETKEPEYSTKTYAIYAFTTLNGDIEPDYISYTTQGYSNIGVKYDEESKTYISADAEIKKNSIVLYPPKNTPITLVSDTAGNSIRINLIKRGEKSYIKKISLGIGENSGTLNISTERIQKGTLYAANKNTIIEKAFEDENSIEDIYISNISDANTYNSTAIYITSIKITYALEGTLQTTSVYLASSTGAFQVPYSESAIYADPLKQERSLLFNGQFTEYENQLLSFNKYNLFISGVDSTIFSAMKTLTFSTEIVNTLKWREYLLIFTEKDIYLSKYDYESNSYILKTLSTAIGVPKKDADTIVCILNSVYFKAGYKIYRLVPNIYASSDDILNLHSISDGIDTLIEETLSSESETKNFVYADAYRYYLFVPIVNKDLTYCFVYDYVRKIWNLCTYPKTTLSLENLGLTKEYLKTSDGIYYFKERISTLLNQQLQYDSIEIGYSEDDTINIVGFTDNNATETACIISDTYTRMSKLIPKLPYADFLDTSLDDIYYYLSNNSIFINDDTNTIHIYNNNVQIQMTPIEYLIDFGQKSSNYTLYKTFLESKLTLATLHEKDTFPFNIYIEIDGMQSPLHWDVNTDSALWKNSFSQKGTLSTLFTSDNSNYNGIMRQLIVKYSGKGKTIRHLITGKSKYNFKFYSMDVKSRLLPKKQ